MQKYDFIKSEKKWQKIWDERAAHTTNDNDKKPKYYCLDMFPYPSGSGLHVGHWRGYVLSDVWCRYKKLKGFNILHPMGWDAFGSPAENDAIKKKTHPRINTQKNIDNMKRQLKEIGAMYDWSREISTSAPDYYHWTQWIFLQMYKKGLAYKDIRPINWCPSCKTGISNEEVVNGCCERCGTETSKKNLKQWLLRITKYADRLLWDLDKLDWPEKVKLMQANWIGRSEGAEIVFKLISAQDITGYDVKVFTTRPDTLYGATYMVLAPEHELVLKICSKENIPQIKEYIKKSQKITEIERTSTEKEKTGIFTGAYAVNPVNGQKIPVWISDYVLISYGSGAIMAVPAHDERDFEFATKFKLPIIEVIHNKESNRNDNSALKEAYAGEGEMMNSGQFNGIHSSKGQEAVVEKLAEKNLAKKTVNYKLRDWIFSRQRYWGEPIPIVYCEKCGEVLLKEEDLPVILPEIENYQPTGTGESPLAEIEEWVNTECPKCGGKAKRETDTMPNWAGSCWYFLRYVSPNYNKGVFDKELVDKWLPVDMYVGGIEHAILHLLYSRFFTKFLYDIGAIDFDEPFKRLFNQGMICRKSEKTGKVEKMSKSKGNVVNPDELVNKYGRDALRLYELFIGPPEQESEWSDQGIEGIHRFIKRVWDWVIKSKDKLSDSSDLKIQIQENIFIKNVSERVKGFKFNTAISSMIFSYLSLCSSFS
jgi:leucyl-tRNA synthetase